MLPVSGAPANLRPRRSLTPPDIASSTGPELALLAGVNVLSAADRELARETQATCRRLGWALICPVTAIGYGDSARRSFDEGMRRSRIGRYLGDFGPTPVSCDASPEVAMSENQPSEHDRQQRLAELQARLQKLTEERKAELRRLGPLPADVIPPTAEDDAADRAVEKPEPVEAVASPAAPDVEAAPVAHAVDVAPQASESTPPVPSPSAVPPADPQPPAPPPPERLPVLETSPPMEAPADHQSIVAATTPLDSERPTWLSGTPPAEATPVAGTPRPSALSAAAAALAGKISVLAGEAKRAAQGLGRQATAKSQTLKSQRPPRRPRAQRRPDSPAAGEEPAAPRAKKRRSLRAAVLLGSREGRRRIPGSECGQFPPTA
jgi:hypothetical protein